MLWRAKERRPRVNDSGIRIDLNEPERAWADIDTLLRPWQVRTVFAGISKLASICKMF
jgi:hypothetical protein